MKKIFFLSVVLLFSFAGLVKGQESFPAMDYLMGTITTDYPATFNVRLEGELINGQEIVYLTTVYFNATGSQTKPFPKVENGYVIIYGSTGGVYFSQTKSLAISNSEDWEVQFHFIQTPDPDEAAAALEEDSGTP